MKVSEAQLRAAIDRPPADLRLILLHGPDEAGASAHAARLARALGPEAERVDLDGATLRADPARLADEAASLSLFGGTRHIRVTGAGEESLAALETLLAAPSAGNPVVMIAPGLKATSKLVKAALEARTALAFACYVPTGDAAAGIVAGIAREHGLRPVGQAAARLARAAAGDRAVMTREIEKLADYLDAAPDRPRDLDDAALDAVGADLNEAGIGEAVEAVVAGRRDALAAELARLDEAGTSPIVWLRQLARRFATLAEMRAEVDAGAPVQEVIKRHRVFFREETATAQALRRWPASALAAAHARVRAAERGVMASANAGSVLAAHAALVLAGSRAR